MTTTATTAGETSAEQVIAAAIHEHEIETGAAVRKLQLAVEWVRLHPGEEVDTSVEWGMRELEIAGDGAPTVDEGAVAEFALAIGHSTDSGRRYLGDAVELAYRLPRTWARVLSGEVGVWKARRIAQVTASLPAAGCGGRRSGVVLRGGPVLVCGDRPAGGEGAQGARPGRDRTPQGRGRGEAAREGPPGGDDL